MCASLFTSSTTIFCCVSFGSSSSHRWRSSSRSSASLNVMGAVCSRTLTRFLLNQMCCVSSVFIPTFILVNLKYFVGVHHLHVLLIPDCKTTNWTNIQGGKYMCNPLCSYVAYGFISPTCGEPIRPVVNSAVVAALLAKSLTA